MNKNSKTARFIIEPIAIEEFRLEEKKVQICKKTIMQDVVFELLIIEKLTDTQEKDFLREWSW